MTVALAALLALAPPLVFWRLLRRPLVATITAVGLGAGLWFATHAAAQHHLEALRAELREGPPHAWAALPPDQQHALHAQIQGRVSIGKGLASAADVAAVIAGGLSLALALRALYRRRLPGVGQADIS